uniref:Fungal lipase-type domain-containing protein n=1 Tax=Noctiluca scintillans TaxID=2966 RepID=A0A7S1F8A6_NOCSC
MKALCKLDAPALACHAEVLVRRLRDTDWCVRRGALAGLGKLDGEVLALHAEEIAVSLGDHDTDVRRSAIEVLGRLAPSVLENRAEAIAQRLGDSVWSVRRAAVEVLGMLEPSMLASYADAIVRCFRDVNSAVHCTAVKALSRLEPTALAKHADLIVQRVGHGDRCVSRAAVEALGKLDRTALAHNKQAISRRFVGKRKTVRLSDAHALVPMAQNMVFRGGTTLLHAACLQGTLALAKPLIQTHRAELLNARTAANETPLHFAARGGHLEICQELVQAGALIRGKNRRRKTAEQLASRSGHSEVAQYLRACTRGGTHGGTGDALTEARADSRPVVKVEWHTMGIRGTSRILGVRHSLLVVMVGDAHTGFHEYVIEKADPPLFENGIYVSHWADVRSCIEDPPIHTLKLEDLDAERQCVKQLVEHAIATGPYDVARRNCHHAALELYNLCAKPQERVRRMPNSVLSRAARVLQSLGVNVAHSAPAASTSQGVALTSAIDVASPGPLCGFPIDGNCPGHDHSGAQDCAQLSLWIYDSDLTVPVLSAPVEDWEAHLAQDGRVVQWASVLSGDTLYMTFRGTSEFVDCVIDMSALAFDHAAHGVRVHAGAWTALHQRRHDVAALAAERVKSVREKIEGKLKLVLCGHSLGGAYAILTALELQHLGEEVSAVMTFGSPHVLVPPRPEDDNGAWQRLSDITTSYVNAYDVIARLPSCLDWLEALPQALSARMGAFMSHSDVTGLVGRPLEGQRENLCEYDTVGTLMFLTVGSRSAMKIETCPKTRHHRTVLARLPEKIGSFIVSQHQITEYASIISDLRVSRQPAIVNLDDVAEAARASPRQGRAWAPEFVS